MIKKRSFAYSPCMPRLMAQWWQSEGFFMCLERCRKMTRSVETCIPTLERAERSSQLSCGALRRMPFWTLRVLFATRSVETCIPTLERAERSSRLSCGALRRMPSANKKPR
ncbi:hypothetical protein ALO54_101569 [Pseudomonas syringae pv. philadelphi]|nr:hypothetical protein ALO86_101393 [Pseudomonas syringae pv. berberidis]KPY14053.1 hypothetical protein ALO54_101569 [Pseudomonas syringae pv. philadelphi]RMM36615.1 hypothetical protein ALQ83_101614 [Pseudomonas syringae pv. berberidis]RMP70714.1 hypothetical protein ALQ19_101632 [Pseudomonas syringae pv. berberidis]RMQ30989.1 hypothetical protein ALQ06_101577 [Pseudomonas syringae pv. berberidis]